MAVAGEALLSAGREFRLIVTATERYQTVNLELGNAASHSSHWPNFFVEIHFHKANTFLTQRTIAFLAVAAAAGIIRCGGWRSSQAAHRVQLRLLRLHPQLSHAERLFRLRQHQNVKPFEVRRKRSFHE